MSAGGTTSSWASTCVSSALKSIRVTAKTLIYRFGSSLCWVETVVGVNNRVDAQIEALAADASNNIVIISPRAAIAAKGEKFYHDRRCAIVHSTVALFDAQAKILMLADERLICFDECTLVQPVEEGAPGDAEEWDHPAIIEARKQRRQTIDDEPLNGSLN